MASRPGKKTKRGHLHNNTKNTTGIDLTKRKIYSRTVLAAGFRGTGGGVGGDVGAPAFAVGKKVMLPSRIGGTVLDRWRAE